MTSICSAWPPLDSDKSSFPFPSLDAITADLYSGISLKPTTWLFSFSHCLGFMTLLDAMMALYVAQSTVFDYPMHFSGERSNSGTIISRGVSVRTIICDMKQPKLNRAVVETHRLRTTKVRSLLHLNRHNVALPLISIHPLDWDRKCGEIITCPQICQSILIDKSD